MKNRIMHFRRLSHNQITVGNSKIYIFVLWVWFQKEKPKIHRIKMSQKMSASNLITDTKFDLKNEILWIQMIRLKPGLCFLLLIQIPVY